MISLLFDKSFRAVKDKVLVDHTVLLAAQSPATSLLEVICHETSDGTRIFLDWCTNQTLEGRVPEKILGYG